MDNSILLNKLLEDEVKNNKDLYSSGPYWVMKNSKTAYEIKKKGLKDFRGLSAGIGTSFSDNIVYDQRNELNARLRIISFLLSLPYLKTIYNAQLKITSIIFKIILKLYQLFLKIIEKF